MTIKVQLFAALKDLLGKPEIEIELPDDATVASLRATLIEQYPNSEPIVSRSAFALDSRFVADKQSIQANHQVACIPPVSGG